MSRLKKLRRRYATLLAEVDQEIRPVLEAVEIDTLARNNSSLLRYGADPFTWFIEYEKGRFLNALDWIQADRSRGAVIDLGCLFPYLPLALAKLGFTVTVVEKFELYGAEFALAVRRVARANKIEVVDLDIVNDSFTQLGKADVVLLMAVVEHLIGPPRQLMTKIHEMLADDGFLQFEVPNIAPLSRRLAFLFGRSPLPSYQDYLNSAYPYFGHNREMTTCEVKYLMKATGFHIERFLCYEYNLSRPVSWGDSVARWCQSALASMSCASAISVKARKA